MKGQTYLIGIITIAVSILSVHCHYNRGCDSLSYRKPMSDGPDMMVAQWFEEETPNKSDNEESNRYWVSCRFSSNRMNATHQWDMENFESYMRNKLAYDLHSRTMYAGIRSRIRQLLMDRSLETDLRDSPATPYMVEGLHHDMTRINAIAYDWVTKNFFVADRVNINVGNLNDERARSIYSYEAHKKESKFPEHLEEKATEMYMSAWEPRDMKMIVHPSRGYLFVKLNSQVLFRMDQDGKNKVMLRNYENETSVSIKSIVMDYYTDRLYVLEIRQEGNKNMSKIYHLNLDGDDMVTLKMDNSHAHYVPVMAVDKDYVYFALSEHSHYQDYYIHRAGKTDGMMDVDFEIRNSKPEGQRVNYNMDELIVFVPQEEMKDHPCGINRGGCPVHCVAVPGADMKLTKICVG